MNIFERIIIQRMKLIHSILKSDNISLKDKEHLGVFVSGKEYRASPISIQTYVSIFTVFHLWIYNELAILSASCLSVLICN